MPPTPITITTYQFDARGRVTSIQNLNQDDGVGSLFHNMIYDSVDELISALIQVDRANNAPQIFGSASYGFDQKGELVSDSVTGYASYGGNWSFVFGYDPAGNIINLRGVPQTYNANNQITTGGTTQYLYDRNGDPSTYQGNTGWLFDAEGRLVLVPGKLNAAWKGDGLRAYKLNGASRVYFLYDGDLRLCDLDSTGTVTNEYGYGPGGLLQRHTVSGNFMRTYLFDHNSNLVQRSFHTNLTNTGNIQDNVAYDDFGMLHKDTGANTGLDFPVNDDVGPLGQWGVFTDGELRTTTTTGLPMDSDGDYYDPSTGTPLTRTGADGLMGAWSYGKPSPGTHLVVDGLAFVPGLGIPFNILSGVMSIEEGDWPGVGLSVLGIIPIEGQFATLSKLGREAKALEEAERGVQGIARGLRTGEEAEEALKAGRGFAGRGGAIGQYAREGGHHIHAKAAFKWHPNYNPGRAVAISQEYMTARGMTHASMTAFQHEQFGRLARDVAAGVRANTMAEHSRIAYGALRAGGASRAEAGFLVWLSHMNLRGQGVFGPTRIPWH